MKIGGTPEAALAVMLTLLEAGRERISKSLDDTAIFSRTELKCSRCGTSLVRITSSALDKIVCPNHLGFDDYRESETGPIDLAQGPIVNPVLIHAINRFWLTGRQPA